MSDTEVVPPDRTHRVYIVEQPAPKAPSAKSWPDIFKDNFVALFTAFLATVTAAITGVLGYYFVTARDMGLKEVSIANDRLAKTEALFIEREKLALERDKVTLTSSQEALKGAAMLKEHIPVLLSGRPKEVENAAITLALSGRTNTEVLIATLATPNQNNSEQVLAGLRVAAARNHDETCSALCAYAVQLTLKEADAIGNLAPVLGKLRCTGAKDLLEYWKKNVGDNPVIANNAIALAAAGGPVPEYAARCKPWESAR